MIVADANLIAAYCITSPLTATAKQVFAKDRAWIAPKLWQSEFVSALLKYHRARQVSDDEAMRAIYLAHSLMRGMDYDSDLHKVFAVARRTTCSAYDSCYVALAEEMRMRVVTTDGGMVTNAPHVAMSPEQYLAEVF